MHTAFDAAMSRWTGPYGSLSRSPDAGFSDIQQDRVSRGIWSSAGLRCAGGATPNSRSNETQLRPLDEMTIGSFTLFAQMCEDNGLPRPEREWEFHHTRNWRLDIAWPSADHMLALEVEGG